MSEELHASDLRFFVETAPGSGVAAGDVISPRLNAADASRITNYMEETVSPFRGLGPRESVLEFPAVNIALHVDRNSLDFILAPHLTGSETLNFRSPSPTFCLQLESDAGDLIQFSGMAIRELQMSIVARGIVSLFVSFFALERTNGIALLAVTSSPEPDPVAGWQVDVVAKAGPLSPDPQADDALDGARSAEFYMKRDLEVSQFDAFGTPTRHNVGPWRVFGEFTLTADAFTETASGSYIDGSAAIFLGPSGGNSKFLFDNSVRFLSVADPIRADDFRDFRVLFQAEANTSGNLFTYSKTS